jgi:hypothetical protein
MLKPQLGVSLYAIAGAHYSQSHITHSILAATSSTRYPVLQLSDLYLCTAQTTSNKSVKLATSRFRITSPLNRPCTRFCASAHP